MAYALKYELLCRTRLANSFSLKLLFDGYTGSPVNRDVPLSPFFLNKDCAGIIRGTSLQFSVREENDFEFLEFYTNNSKYIKAELYLGSTLIWAGYVTPQQYQVPYKPSPCNVTFTATDGLGLLKNEEFTLTGNQSQLEIIRHCIDKIGLNLGYAIAINLFEANHNENYTSLEQTYEDASIYGDKSCYEVLEKIIGKYNATITQCNGRWHIKCRNDVEEAPLLYDYQGNYEGIGSAPSVLNLGSDVQPVGNLQMSLEPGGKKVELVHDFGRKNSFFVNYDFGNYSSSMFDNWTKSGSFNVLQRDQEGRKYAFLEGWTNDSGLTDYIEQAVGPVEASSDDHVFEIDFAPIGNQSGISYRASIYMTVRMVLYLHAGGTTYYYLTKNGWSTTGQYIDQTVLSSIATPEWNKIKILTDSIPASGTLYVRLCRYYAINCPSDTTYAGVAFSNILFYALHDAQQLPGKVIAQANFDNSTEPNDLGEIDLFCADAPDYDNNIHQFLYITRLSDGSATSLWHRKGSVTEYSLLIQLARMLASDNRIARQKLTGKIKGAGISFDSIIEHVYNNNRKFEIVEGSYDVYEERWEVTLLEILSWSDESITFSSETSQGSAAREQSSGIPLYYQGNVIGMSWPSTEGIPFYTGQLAWGDSLSLSSSGNRWNVLPLIGNDGVMEIGKYIDFHESNADTSDAAGRIYFDAGSFYINTGTSDPIAYLGENSSVFYNSGAALLRLAGGCVGIGTSNPEAKLHVVGSIYGTSNLQNPLFSSGFNGDKWRISAEGEAEFENLFVRGSLTVYELLINQLRYQNGGLIIGAGAGKVRSIYDSTKGGEKLYFQDPTGNNYTPFSVGAIVMIQHVDVNRSSVVKKIVRQVSAIQSDMRVDLTTTSGWLTSADVGVFEEGDEVCAIGHVSNSDYQNSIYLSAIDSGNPFMRVFAGVDSYSDWSLSDKSCVKLQIGNLAGLAGYDILPADPGYGLYCANAYLTGRIVLPDAGMTNEGSSDSDIRIWAGESYANRATAPFRVTQDGSLTATGIAELGTNTANYEGKTSNIAIKNADIWENSYNGDNSAIHINRVGYQGGTSKYRHVRVYDGKGTAIFAIQGDLGITYTLNLRCDTAAVFNGTAEIEGKLTCDGTVEFNDTTQFDALATHNANVYIPNNKLCVGSSSPNAYACVDFSAGKRDGTNPGALVLPIMTTSQRNSLVATQGMIIYNSTTGLIDVCTAAGWRYLQTATY